MSPVQAGRRRAAAPTGLFDAHRLEQVFANCFEREWRTRLVGGATEPLYQPATGADAYHTLYYRSDYFASALHEVAHWCLAGERRRSLPDYGYWYAPDGRDPQQQLAFEAVEYKPQALEWWFARACGYRFRISVDNLEVGSGSPAATAAFRRRVLQQARHWQGARLPPRASQFLAGLYGEFGAQGEPPTSPFALADLA